MNYYALTRFKSSEYNLEFEFICPRFLLSTSNYIPLAIETKHSSDEYFWEYTR